MGRRKKGTLAQSKAYLRANALLLNVSKAHRAEGTETQQGTIHSVETFEKYAANIAKAANYLSVTMIRDITPDLAHKYLLNRISTGIGQKQLDSDRRALELLTKEKLTSPKALKQRQHKRRAYTRSQVQAVIERQSPKNALATSLAHEAGLRGQELLTLRPVGTGAPISPHREWSTKRFFGRAGVRYLVTGKGGLTREVMFSPSMVRELEKQRLLSPRRVKDRHVNNIIQHYDLAGGNSWESSFSKASKRVLGFSNGAHGLRHSYAQERMAHLVGAGFIYYRAREVVANEMGHFRGSITETYLR